MKSNSLVKLMSLLIFILIVLMVFTFITLPFLVLKYSQITGLQTKSTLGLTIFLYLTAIPFIVLLVMAKKLCSNVLHNEPFCRSSISVLNVMSICAFVEFLLYAIGTIIILKSLLGITLMIAAFMVGFVCIILAQIVRTAMEIKQENDLMI